MVKTIIMNDGNDEKVVSSQTWDKMARSLHQEGYREGSAVGRDLTFQQGFDLGYMQGFQVGYKLGLHSGILRYLKSTPSSVDPTLDGLLSTIEPFEKPSRGMCVVCLEEDKNKRNIDDPFSENETAIKSLTEIEQQQNKLLFEKEKLVLTESYLLVLKSTKLDQLIEQRVL